jgi:hypothetical protein
VIAGTDQANQGSYLCSLRQQVFRSIDAGPGAGQHRRTNLYARVFEPGGTAEGYWDIVTVNGAAGPTSADPPNVTAPPSSTLLASIYPIVSGTGTINAALITDRRFRAKNPLSSLYFVEVRANVTLDYFQHGIVMGGVDVTITLPPPSKDQICGVFIGAGTATINTTSGVIRGPAMNQTSLFMGNAGAQVLFQSNGTNWYMISGHPDTGWINLSLPSYIDPNPANPPAARKQGDYVLLRGRFSRTLQINAGLTVAFLGSRFTPARGWWVPAAIGGAGNTLLVSSDGFIQPAQNIPPGAWNYLDGINYSMD